MNTRAIFIIAIAVIAIAVGWLFLGRNLMTLDDDTVVPAGQEGSSEGGQRVFSGDGLNTNTARTSIDLKLVLDGGPGKDGIPALDRPKFVSVDAVGDDLRDQSLGMLVTVGGTSRFYPYNIMNWHEIVNDTIEGRALAVTFCPLCGSAIVFNANVQGEVLTFGVSGKLYESNLLMFDRTTESLWSQALGEAVVGDKLGAKLEIYPTQLMTFSQVREQFPEAQILSRDTGHSRGYDFDPYSGYGDSDSTFFPISVRDERFPAKELFYVVPVGKHSVALKLKDLTAGVSAKVPVGTDELVASAENGILTVRLNGEGESLPSYVEMWFSWAIHHQDDGIVWQKK